ncbi:GNAT family N-acetyltransferase [Variovorax sp. OV329]|uniref:GNAT family N-acetyltransferase n=1 Tax=Variovorax sp. OV329 TaxID=1882825 RepID=UPI0008EFA6CD|nr:GNAT family N-acetyltransferase [Variovorax sp. OV329]SFM77258.1 FR47-like protein [Variovorax sp. OV329]
MSVPVPAPDALLDNLFWHALGGAQSHFAAGDGEVRRFAAGFSPIVAFADPSRPRLDALLPLCAQGEQFYCDGWSSPAPAGWQIDAQALMRKMIWRAPPPAEDEAPDAKTLVPGHLPQILELVALTRPGPFGVRTIELGEYFGFFDEGGRLMAMAGERCHAGALREISGVCTHPDFQGRGLARRLMAKLVRRQMQRGETPVLHVMSTNEGAVALYRRMGFADHRESVVRVISRT